jgi:hypothetical protein
MSTYRIVRFFERSDRPKLVLSRGHTLVEAQAHCQDPETSSKTCTTDEGKRWTRAEGAWFDGFEKEST